MSIPKQRYFDQLVGSVEFQVRPLFCLIGTGASGDHGLAAAKLSGSRSVPMSSCHGVREGGGCKTRDVVGVHMMLTDMNDQLCVLQGFDGEKQPSRQEC